MLFSGSSSHASTHHHGNQKGGHRTQQISQSDLKKKSDQHVNVQVRKVEVSLYICDTFLK